MVKISSEDEGECHNIIGSAVEVVDRDRKWEFQIEVVFYITDIYSKFLV